MIVAAGTLGTAQIMLNSARLGLQVSDRVGHGFSANGDFAAVSFNGSHPLSRLGDAPNEARTGKTRFEALGLGTTISSHVDLRSNTG